MGCHQICTRLIEEQNNSAAFVFFFSTTRFLFLSLSLLLYFSPLIFAKKTQHITTAAPYRYIFRLNRNEMINFLCVRAMDDHVRRLIDNGRTLNFENIELSSLLVPLLHLHRKHK